MIVQRVSIGLVVACLAFFGSTCTRPALLHYDGLYLFKDKEAWKQSVLYLRFYPDKTVLFVSSIGNPTQVAEWFHREGRGYSIGEYLVRGERIQFTVFGFESRTDCAGTIEERVVVLQCQGADVPFRFEFMPIQLR